MTLNPRKGAPLMARTNTLPNRHWIEQTLTPYLRHAFSHAIPYGADIRPRVQHAIEFCATQAVGSLLRISKQERTNHLQPRPEDGNDLLFERVCLAIEFRHKNLAPDSIILMQNLESLAKFLIRRAQLKGPYELLSRMNIGSGAWREYESARIEKLREAAEVERKGEGLMEILQVSSTDRATARPLLDPLTQHKAAPKENEIDPRLVSAQSGQYVSPSLSGTLSVIEDHYFRQQHRALDGYRQNGSFPQPAQRQLATLSPPKQPLHRGTSNEGTYGMQTAFDSAPVRSQVPTCVPSLGLPEWLSTPQPQVSHVSGHNNTGGALHVFRVPLSTSVAVEPPGATHLYTLKNGTTFRYRPVPPQQPPSQNSGIEAASFQGLNLDPPFPTRSNEAFPSRVIHLHSEQWNEAAQRRADEFSFLT
jgi:hypothetical protein